VLFLHNRIYRRRILRQQHLIRASEKGMQNAAAFQRALPPEFLENGNAGFGTEKVKEPEKVMGKEERVGDPCVSPHELESDFGSLESLEKAKTKGHRVAEYGPK
jgi:hypothetical protein